MSDESNLLMVGMLSGRKNLAWKSVEPLNLEELLLADGRISEAQVRAAKEIQEAVHGFAPDRVPSLGQVLLYTGVVDAWALAAYGLRRPAATVEEPEPLPSSQEYRVIFDFELAQA